MSMRLLGYFLSQEKVHFVKIENNTSIVTISPFDYMLPVDEKISFWRVFKTDWENSFFSLINFEHFLSVNFFQISKRKIKSISLVKFVKSHSKCLITSQTGHLDGFGSGNYEERSDEYAVKEVILIHV